MNGPDAALTGVGVVVVVLVALARPLWACALVLATAAWGNRALAGIPWGLQVVHAMCVLALVGALFAVVTGAPVDRLRRPELRLPLLFAGLLVVAAAVSTVTSVSVEKSVKVSATLAAGLLYSLSLVLVARTPRHLRLVLGAAAVGSTFVTIPTITSARDLISVYGGASVKHRPTSGFGSPNELGCYAAIVLLLALGWLVASHRMSHRVGALLSAAAAAAALTVGLSRGAWFGTVLGLTILVVLHPRTRRPAGWLVVGGAVAVLGALLLVPLSGPAQVVAQRVTSVSDPDASPDDVRPITWEEALRVFGEAPIVGNGPGSFGVLMRQSNSELQFYPREHAHNGLLNVAAEMGSVGVLALTGMVGSTVTVVRRRARQLRAACRWDDLGVLAGGAAALGALTGHLVVDYPLSNPLLMFTVWAAFGLVLAAVAMPAGPGTGHPTVTTYASAR